MAVFENAPLLCEAYVAEPGGSFTEVACPFPTSQHIFTQANWEPNTASLRCNGNNNTLCALSSTPLIQSTYTTTVQLLEQIRTAESLLDDTKTVESCDFASDSALAVWTQTCSRDQIQAPLMGAWITGKASSLGFSIWTECPLLCSFSQLKILPQVLLLQHVDLRWPRCS